MHPASNGLYRKIQDLFRGEPLHGSDLDQTPVFRDSKDRNFFPVSPTPGSETPVFQRVDEGGAKNAAESRGVK